MKTLLVGLNAKYYHTNLAIRNIKWYCQPMEIDILEMTINDDTDYVLYEILKKMPDVVGFSCYIWNIEKVLKLCEYIKKVREEIIVVLGGPEVSYDAENLLKANYIDFVVLGEGELAFKKLLERIYNSRSMDDLDGIAYRKNEEIIVKIKTDYVNLDDIPFPYIDEEISDRLVYYETSRGCPFRCSYCLSSLDNRLRYATIEKVKADLRTLSKMGAKIVKLIDRSFDSNIKRAIEILNIIRELKGDTVFHCEVNPELINKEFIDSLKGIEDRIQFEVGIQTTNKSTLIKVSRNPDVESALNGIKLIVDAGIKVHVDLIAGLPGDSFKSVANSFNDVYKLNPDEIQLGFLKLLKGTDLRKNADKYFIEFRCDAPYEVLKTSTMSYYELHELKSIAFLVDKYYNSGRFNKTLNFLLSFYDEPFDLYKSMYDYWESNNLFNRRHSLNDLFDIMYKFAVSKRIDSMLIKDYLRYDYMFSTNNKAYPNCLKDLHQKIPDNVKSLLHNDEWLQHNLPLAKNMSSAEKGKNISIGFFKHDILGENDKGVYIAFCIAKTRPIVQKFMIKEIDIMPETLVIAHRGDSKNAPENTLSSFKRAVEIGSDGIELDVQLSKDGHLVVIHDERVDRTTDGIGYVKDYTLSELKRLSAGIKFSKRFAGEKILTLPEVLELLKNKDVLLNIEIKSGMILYPGIEEKLVNCIFDYDFEDRVLISSFNHYSVKIVKEIEPRLNIGLLYECGLVEPWHIANRMHAYSLHPFYFNIIPEVVKGCKSNNVKLFPWTVDSVESMEKMLRFGVDGIITNDPQQLLNLKKKIN